MTAAKKTYRGSSCGRRDMIDRLSTVDFTSARCPGGASAHRLVVFTGTVLENSVEIQRLTYLSDAPERVAEVPASSSPAPVPQKKW